MTTTLASLAGLTDAELAARCASGDDETVAECIAECERRERAERARQARKAGSWGELERQWEEMAYGNYRRAEAFTAGNLLSEAGKRTGRDPFPMLWQGNRESADLLASQELITWWDYTEPRPLGEREFCLQAFSAERGAAQEAAEAGERGESDMLGAIAGGVIRAGVRAQQANARQQSAPRPTIDDALARAKRAAAGIPEFAGGSLGTVAVPGAAAPAMRPASPVLLVRQPKMDGARLLNQSYRFIGGLGVWPDDHSKVAASLYAASTHGKDPKTHLPVFPYRPRLFFTSDEGGSGKTRLNKSTAMLCHDPVSLIESSKAGFIGMIRKYRTVIVTELDNWVGPTGRRNSWLLGIGNAGYEPGHVHTHKESGESVEIDLFGDMILDGLAKAIFNTGTNLTTFVSRAIIVWVRRAPEGYHAPRITKQIRAFADDGKMRLAAWMQQEIEDGLEDDEPDMTGLPGNRPGALWEPLIMTADRAGGEWPELAREACLHLESPAGKTATTIGAIDAADAKLDEWGF